MTDIDTNQTVDLDLTKPPEEVNPKDNDPNYRKIYVEAFTNKAGRTFPAHIRYMRRKRGPQMAYDPVGHRKLPKTELRKKQKQRASVDAGSDSLRASHSDWNWATARLEKKRSQKPAHHVDPKYASEVYSKLETTLAFIAGLRLIAQYPFNPELNETLKAMQVALTEVRAFVNHFTTHPTME